MTDVARLSTLEELLDRLCGATDGRSEITIDEMLKAAGTRSFGTMLLVPGLVALSPLGGIPGVPTALAVLILLIAGQMLIGRECFWLPKWALKRKAGQERMQKALRFMRPIARFVDKLLRQRLTWLTRGPAIYVIALLCIGLAATMPFLDPIPFANTPSDAAVTAFGLSLLSHDGLLALIAAAFCGGVIWLLVTRVL